MFILMWAHVIREMNAVPEVIWDKIQIKPRREFDFSLNNNPH